jgi:hypothetical protein
MERRTYPAHGHVRQGIARDRLYRGHEANWLGW